MEEDTARENGEYHSSSRLGGGGGTSTTSRHRSSHRRQAEDGDVDNSFNARSSSRHRDTDRRRGDEYVREKCRERERSRSRHGVSDHCLSLSHEGKGSSKWDMEQVNEAALQAQMKPYSGGFSSVPPPAAVVTPNSEGVNGTTSTDAAAAATAGQNIHLSSSSSSSTTTTGANGTADVSGASHSNTSTGCGLSSVGMGTSDVNAVPGYQPNKTATDIEAERKQRRLYIGCLPKDIKQEEVVGFFNGALLALAARMGIEMGDDPFPVTRCEAFNTESRFCFLEFKSLELTWACLKLDGICITPCNQLRVGRPHDYVPPPGGDPALTAVLPGLENVSMRQGESKAAVPPPRPAYEDQKVLVQNIPADMSDEQVKVLLEQFGSLRVFNIMKDSATGLNRGYGFFEYEDVSVTDNAIQALSGTSFGSGQLLLQRTSAAAPQHSTQMIQKSTDKGVSTLSGSMSQKILGDALVGLQVNAGRKVGEAVSRVVQLLNTVFLEDLVDPLEYTSILEEVKGEAEKYGPLVEVVIPKPNEDMSYREGVGKIFLHFADETASRKAQMMLNGRRFNYKRVVCAAFYPVDKFQQQKYVLA